MFIIKSKPKGSTAFSTFIRTASSEKKKRVYEGVLKKATERQNNLLRAAKAVK